MADFHGMAAPTHVIEQVVKAVHEIPPHLPITFAKPFFRERHAGKLVR